MPSLEPPEIPPLLNPSTAIPCENVSKDCLPCDDDPIENFTAEGPDSDRFLFLFRAHVVPPLGVVPGDVDRPGICYSELSLQDAEDCARQEAEEPLVNQPVYNGVSHFHNTVQSCTGSCPDGSLFTYTVPAGTVVAFTQLEADQRAMGLACQRARTNRVCILTTALKTGCLGSAYSMTLKGLGGTGFVVSWFTLPFFEECSGEVTIGSAFPYLWWITSGELPDGLTLHPCSGVIDGTPTEVGDFPITMRAIDATGAFLSKNFTLRVAEIANDSPLTQYTVGTPYVVNFSTTIGDQEQQTWTVLSGTLPTGLTLSAAGVLSGTPTTEGDSSFTVQVVESGSSGFTCQKSFSLSSSITTPISYWKMNDASFGTRQDTLGIANLTDSNNNVSAVSGLIGNAALFSAGTIAFLETQPNVTKQYFFSTGWTFIGWVKTIILPSTSSFIFTLDSNLAPQLDITLIGGGPGQMRFDYKPTAASPFTTIQVPFNDIGSWHFLRCWFDPSDMKLKVQIDMGSISESAAIAAPSVETDTYIGFGNPGDGEFQMDECGFFGAALSDAAATEIYNGGIGKTCCPFT